MQQILKLINFFIAGIKCLDKINVDNKKKEYLREVAVKMINRNK